MNTTLIIGDAHADLRYSDNSRFTALGNLIVDRRPTSIVQIGDFGNLDSISFHNKGRPLIQEGMRLFDDIHSMVDAYDHIMTPIKKLWQRQRGGKKSRYNPNLYWFEGNHEDRVRRYVQENPVLEGFVAEHDLVGAHKDGWTVVHYKDYVEIDNVLYTHVPMNDANSPLGGKYCVVRAAERVNKSLVFGHVHRRELFRRAFVGGVNDNVLNAVHIDTYCAGCYFDYDPDYVRGNVGNLPWWRGLTILTHVPGDTFDIETMHIDRVKEKYL